MNPFGDISIVIFDNAEGRDMQAITNELAVAWDYATSDAREESILVTVFLDEAKGAVRVGGELAQHGVGQAQALKILRRELEPRLAAHQYGKALRETYYRLAWATASVDAEREPSWWSRNSARLASLGLRPQRLCLRRLCFRLHRALARLALGQRGMGCPGELARNVACAALGALAPLAPAALAALIRTDVVPGSMESDQALAKWRNLKLSRARRGKPRLLAGILGSPAVQPSRSRRMPGST